MCGIVGFIGGGGSAEHRGATAGRMADAIARRGPDDCGIWVDADAGLTFGHRRLSIVDLSPAGHQPMVSSCGRWVITFNGEIYNHAELRAELDGAGMAPEWRGHCDTEVLLAAIAAWGIRQALQRCVGMFAFGLWDKRERTLTLARDRLGEKPLYFGWAGKTFLFASELAALQKHPDWQGQIDRDALCLFLRLNYIPAPHTIYRGIRKLLPGTYFELPEGDRTGTAQIYWDPCEVAARGAREPFQGSPDEAVEHLERLVRRSISGQMLADVPVGAFLSGGIDSSTMVALMQAVCASPVRTFSIGFNEDGYDEAPHALRVARHLGTKHTEFYVTMKEAMSVVPRLPSLYSEPFADISQIPTFLVSQLARQQVTVALTGDGGDELFSGYTRYRLAGRLWDVLSNVPQRARVASSHLMRRVSPSRYDALADLPMRLLPPSLRTAQIGDKVHKAANVVGLGSADEMYWALTSLWQQPEDVVVGAEEPRRARSADHLSQPMRRMMYLDLIGYLPDDVLAKVDRASMGVGLETRVPLLDHRIVEFSCSLPLTTLRRHGKSKWPLREILRRYVPPPLTDRPKMGFGVPIDSWLRGPLRDWAEHLLDARRLTREGYFRPAPIRAAWKAHLSGHRNLQYQLWGVLMFQAWHEAQNASVPGHHQTAPASI